MLHSSDPSHKECLEKLLSFLSILCEMTPNRETGFTLENFVLLAEKYHGTKLYRGALNYDNEAVMQVSQSGELAMALKGLVVDGNFTCKDVVFGLVTLFKKYYSPTVNQLTYLLIWARTGEMTFKNDIDSRNQLKGSILLILECAKDQKAKDENQAIGEDEQNGHTGIAGKEQLPKTTGSLCAGPRRFVYKNWPYLVVGAIILGVAIGASYLSDIPKWLWDQVLGRTPPSYTNVPPLESSTVPPRIPLVSLSMMILIVLVIVAIALGIIIWCQHKYRNIGKSTPTNTKNKDKRRKHTKRKDHRIKVKKDDELLSSSASSRTSEVSSSMRVYVVKQSAKSTNRKSPKRSASPALSVPSRAPTAMYAPSGYQNLYHLTKVKPKGKPKDSKQSTANYNVDKKRKVIKASTPTGSSGSNQQSTDSGLTSAILKVPTTIPSTMSTMTDKNKKAKFKKHESITKRR